VRLLADVGFTKRLLQAHNRVLAAAALLARAEAPDSPLQQHPLVSSTYSAKESSLKTWVNDSSRHGSLAVQTPLQPPDVPL
jgi:hypothetical protein